jgi:hypothetical protein
MRAVLSAIVAAAFLLAGCGKKAIELPSDPIDRAATCGIVAAASARVAVPDVKAPLPLEAQGRILHYAMLAGSEGEGFSGETASRVSKRMAELQESVTGGKWKALQAPCDAAYPATNKSEVTLPSGRLDAQLTCEGLADFVTRALEAQEVHYPNELAAHRKLRRELNDALAPGLRARAGGSLDAQRSVRAKSVAEAVQLGSPLAVLERCRERFAKEERAA